MYDGSMIGAGVGVFAVWGYVIAKARRGYVELNPKLLSMVLGGSVEEIEQALEYLQRPDPSSRNHDHDGRRLVREGQYQYYIPSFEHYSRLHDEVERRAYNRQKQSEHRDRVKARRQAAQTDTPTQR